MRLTCVRLLALFALAAPAAAQSVTFTKIVDETTPIRGFGHSPALDGDFVAFLGEDAATSENGIFMAPADGTGSPAWIVAESDALPNVPGQPFRFLDNPEIHAGVVTFTAGYDFSSANNTGIYQGSGGPIGIAYDHADPLVGPNPFEPMVDDSGMFLRSAGGNSSDFLQWSIPLELGGAGVPSPLVAGPLPGGGDLIELVELSDSIAMGGGVVVFSALVGHLGFASHGIYSWDSATSSLGLVANWNSLLPGTSSPFESFLHVHTDGASSVFVGQVGNIGFGGIQGVYKAQLANGGSGPLTEIAVTGQAAPSSSQVFGSFENVAIDGDLVIFEATLGSPFAPTGAGIYGWKAGHTFRILDTTQQLENQSLLGMTFDFRGLDGHRLALRVTFVDPTWPNYHVRFGVFVAELPAALGTNYCISLPNSTGVAATISALGSSSVSANDLVLQAGDVPSNKPGLFVYGPVQSMLPLGNGFLCIGSGSSGIFRQPVVFSSADGVATFHLDYTTQSNPNGVITAGSTWNFQYWYRDPIDPPAGFNLTDGLSIDFAP